MPNPFVIRLTEEERKLLELEARRQRKSLTEVARKAIRDYLKGKKPQKSASEVLLEWASKAKKYKPQFKDENLSTTYKEYLYGAKSPKFGHLFKK